MVAFARAVRDGDVAAEVCDPLLDCQAGTPPLADDGFACTNEICDEDLDAIVSVPDDAICDDLNAFTADTCDAVTGCGHAIIPNCAPVDVPAASAGGRARLGLLLMVAEIIFATRLGNAASGARSSAQEPPGSRPVYFSHQCESLSGYAGRTE